MKRLISAPNLALATLWSDMLQGAGIGSSVQRVYSSGIAGEVPVDQAWPEVWVDDDADLGRTQALLDALRSPPSRQWVCPGCGEQIDGPFEQCWQCGASMPAPADPARGA